MEITTDLVNRYAKGMIYKLCCKDANITEIYIGSTINKHRRKAHHKSVCNNPNSKMYNIRLYQFIRDNGGFDNWDLVILEEYPTENKNELTWKEREWIEKLKPALNSYRPIITTEEYCEYHKKYYEENSEQINERTKKYREENPEKISERTKKYYENNSEQIRERTKKYREENPEKVREISKKYRENNSEKLRERTKKNYENNREKVSEKNKERVKCEICNKDLARCSLTKHKKNIHNA